MSIRHLGLPSSPGHKPGVSQPRGAASPTGGSPPLLATVRRVKSGCEDSGRRLPEGAGLRARRLAVEDGSSGRLADVRGLAVSGGPGNHVRAPGRGGAGRHARNGVPEPHSQLDVRPGPSASLRPVPSSRSCQAFALRTGDVNLVGSCSAMTRPSALISTDPGRSSPGPSAWRRPLGWPGAPGRRPQRRAASCGTRAPSRTGRSPDDPLAGPGPAR
jgi:hypothetical protein